MNGREKFASRYDGEFATHTLGLRDFQSAAVAEVGAGILSGHMRQMVFGPTGSGKTEIAASMAQGVYDRGNRMVFLADRIPLVRQASMRFAKYGIPHGVLQGENSRDRSERVQVCSAQTIEARDIFPSMDVLVIDEAHVRREKIINFVSGWDGPVVGLSATPLSRGLGRIYSRIVNTVTANDLLGRGLLAPLRVYEMREIDMSQEPVGPGGEWSATQVKRRSGEMIGAIVREWERMVFDHFDGPVKTLVFSADIEDGMKICQAFGAAGYDFRQSTHQDSLELTEELLSDFERGLYHGLVSVDRFSAGFDVPEVRCIVGARPYASSLINFLQQLGRGMRTAEGKEYCLYLDFAGNFAGWYDAVLDHWEEGVSSLNQRDRLQPRRREGMERTAVTCSCGMFIGRLDEFCAGCGRRIRRPTAEERRLVNGRLEEILVAPGSRRWMENREWTWMHICRVASAIYKEIDSRRMGAFAFAQYKNLYDDDSNPPARFMYDPSPADRRVERRVFRMLREHRKRSTA